MIDYPWLADHARSHWERARIAARTDHIELFVKIALRRRIERHRSDGRTRIDESLESGSAFRWSARHGDEIRHVAMGGLDPEILPHAGTLSIVPLAGVEETLPRERLDLDTESPLPEGAVLERWLGAAPEVRWIDVGSTVECLLGAGGWIAVRRRHRSWAQIGDRYPVLVAARGFDLGAKLQSAGSSATADSDGFHLAPPAAGGVALALATLFHAPGSALGRAVGAGWSLRDEPRAADGLTGGAFDDAGFPTRRIDLADGRRTLASIEGPGTYWRRSFRDPPRSLPSTLVMDAGELRAGPPGVSANGRCRIVPLGDDVWILETDRGSRRVSPGELLEGCAERVGEAELTSEGVITPALRFD